MKNSNEYSMAQAISVIEWAQILIIEMEKDPKWEDAVNDTVLTYYENLKMHLDF